jgi:hypothetical protein
MIDRRGGSSVSCHPSEDQAEGCEFQAGDEG